MSNVMGKLDKKIKKLLKQNKRIHKLFKEFQNAISCIYKDDRKTWLKFQAIKPFLTSSESSDILELFFHGTGSTGSTTCQYIYEKGICQRYPLDITTLYNFLTNKN